MASATPGWAQLPGLPKTNAGAAAPVEPEAEASDSPRAEAREFLRLAMRKGDFEAAARYLVLPPGEEQRGAELARRLRAVLERHLDIKLDRALPRVRGQSRGRAARRSRQHRPDPRRARRNGHRVSGADAHGRPARAGPSRCQTVQRIDGWYDELPDRWIREAIPERLQRTGPWAVMWWQWLALPVLAALALVAGRVVGGVTTRSCTGCCAARLRSGTSGCCGRSRPRSRCSGPSRRRR